MGGSLAHARGTNHRDAAAQEVAAIGRHSVVSRRMTPDTTTLRRRERALGDDARGHRAPLGSNGPRGRSPPCSPHA